MTAIRSLRAQLTLTFTAIAGVVVLAAAVATVLLMRHATWAPLDAALEEEADTLGTLRSHGPELAATLARIGAETDLGPGKFLRMMTADGRTIARTGKVPPAVAAARLPSAPETRHATVGRGRNSYRVVWYRTPGGGWTEIGVRVHRQARILRRATWAIGSGAVLLLACLAALAWGITTRSTAELARLAGELETIEAGSLGRRLAPRRTTEIDRLAAVLNRLLARLEPAVVHLRRFTADAAHELRTPIAALRAHIEVALARGQTPEAYREGLVDALEQTERLGRLAEDLLTLTTVETGALEARLVRLDAMAREVADFLGPVAQEQGRRFVCDVAGPVSARGAPDLLKRVVLNLVDNAFRHTPPTAEVRLSVVRRNGTAAIEVSDRGDGLPHADQEGLFERFRRGRSAAPGSGLGLALCREIVARHGGEVGLRSAPGAGTTVTVTLPLADEPTSS